jgi:glycosyltransferase involved in cell wall biosynthesis
VAAGLSISIVVITRNHSAALRETLDALKKVKIPCALQTELIVVDNASTDDTAEVIRSAEFANMKVEYLYEPAKGKSHGLNAALQHVQGEIILFTDDDVSVSEDWVERMVEEFARTQADVVVGKIVLAENVIRPWLTPSQRWLLAAPLDQADDSPEVIGANMGIRRSIFKSISRFDPELGPGALGFGEEALFGKQLLERGFKTKYARSAVAVHRVDESRLQRCAWLDTARKLGRVIAHIRYHWEHDDIRAPKVKWFWYMFKLHLRRLLQPPSSLESEGAFAWEISYVQSMEMCRQFCVERRRRRKYSRHGFEKRQSFLILAKRELDLEGRDL